MKSRNAYYSKICLILIVCSTLVGGTIKIGSISLYNFILLIILAFNLGHSLKWKINLKNPTLKFMIFFLLEAIVSILWAPDKTLALEYVRYILILFVLSYLIDLFIDNDNISFFISMMVVILFFLNLIGIWETVTNNHIVSNYLVGGSRYRVMAYVPGGFFYNPNDLATYIMQIIPFSFVSVIYGKKIIKILAMTNIFLSVYVIFKASARTQIILLGILLIVFFILAAKSRKIILVIVFCMIGLTIVYKLFPSMFEIVQEGLKDVSIEEIEMSAADGGSLGTRIRLFQNAIEMAISTFGFGVGAGCHRVLMSKYSLMYHNVGRITVMHNLVGELLADYGIFICVYFIYTLGKLCYKLLLISKNNIRDDIKLLAALFVVNVCMFVICTICSSSIIQLPSLWISMCFIGVLVRINKNDVIREGNYYE